MIHILIFFGGVMAGCWVGIILMALMISSGNNSSGNNTSVNNSSGNDSSGNNSKELDDSNNIGSD